MAKNKNQQNKSESDKVIAKITKYAFDAFSKFDFGDLTDMLNYRGAKFNRVDDGDDIEGSYIYSKPGEYETMEIQNYVYQVVLKAIDRFRIEYEHSQENPDETAAGIIGEYFNRGTGILCRVEKDNVQISYIPIESYGSEY